MQKIQQLNFVFEFAVLYMQILTSMRTRVSYNSNETVKFVLFKSLIPTQANTYVDYWI